MCHLDWPFAELPIQLCFFLYYLLKLSKCFVGQLFALDTYIVWMYYDEVFPMIWIFYYWINIMCDCHSCSALYFYVFVKFYNYVMTSHWRCRLIFSFFFVCGYDGSMGWGCGYDDISGLVMMVLVVVLFFFFLKRLQNFSLSQAIL